MSERRLVVMSHDDFLFFKRAGEAHAGLLGNSWVHRLFDHWEDGITEEEARAGIDWIIGLRKFPNEIEQGRHLDKLTRKVRAAFEETA
jgi:hypothetical protein